MCIGKHKTTPFRVKHDKKAKAIASSVIVGLGFLMMPIGMIGILVRMGYECAGHLMGKVSKVSRSGLYCKCDRCRYKRGEVTADRLADNIIAESPLKEMGAPPEAVAHIKKQLIGMIREDVHGEEIDKMLASIENAG